MVDRWAILMVGNTRVARKRCTVGVALLEGLRLNFWNLFTLSDDASKLSRQPKYLGKSEILGNVFVGAENVEHFRALIHGLVFLFLVLLIIFEIWKSSAYVQTIASLFFQYYRRHLQHSGNVWNGWHC